MSFAHGIVSGINVPILIDAFHATGATELVGRQEELDLLIRRWSKAAAGEGRVVSGSE